MTVRDASRRLGPQAAVLLAATTLGAAMLALSLWASWQDMVGEQSRRIEQLAGALAVHVEEDLLAIDRAVGDLAAMAIEEPRLLDLPRGRIYARVNALERATSERRAYAVVNAHGQMVAASGAGFVDRLDVAERVIFTQRRGASSVDGEARIGVPFHIGELGNAFALTRAIRSDADGYLGVAGAIVPTRSFAADLAPLQRAAGAHVGIYHREGFALSDDAGDTKAAIAMSEGSGRWTSPFSGRLALATVAQLRAYPAVVVVARDVAEVAALWWSQSARHIAIYAGLLLLIAGLNVGLFVMIRRDADRERLAKSTLEGRVRDGIETMHDGIVFWDAQRRLVLWNRRYVELTPGLAGRLRAGMPMRDVARLAIDSLRPDLSPSELDAAVDAWLRRRSGTAEAQEHRLPDGRFVEISDHATRDGGVISMLRDVTESRRAMEHVRLSEARFRAGIESMSEGFSLWDAEDRLIAWNRRYAEMAPAMAEVLREGVTFAETLDHVDRKLGRGAVRLEGGVYSDRRRNRRAHLGEVVEVVNSVGRIIEIMDSPTTDGGIVTINRDVTEAREAAARLSESEARFRDGIESMGEGFMLWDRDDRLVVWNARLTDLTPSQAKILRIGMTFSEYIDALAKGLADRVTEPGVSAYLARRRARRSHPGELVESEFNPGRVLQVIERPMRDGGIVTIMRDVSAERIAARRLAANEARFRDFADVASDWFWETDAAHRYTFISTGVEKIGFVPADLVGISRFDFAQRRTGGVPDDLARLRQLMDDHVDIRDFVFFGVRLPGGEPVPIELNARALFDDTGAFLGYRGTGTDVTERVRQQAELERALASEREMNQQQRRFVSIASHEFRTPLAVIDGATQRIIARLGNASDDVARRLDRIRSAVSRMTEIIDRTLSSARLDEGRIDFQPRPFDLVALMREVCGRQRQIAREFEIREPAAPASLTIEGDPRLIDQVLTNLLSNAVKYSGHARLIAVDLTEREDAVEIAVADHGVGIPVNEQPRLFTRFFRASTAGGIPGTGIGLHLIKELVALHGGDVRVSSVVDQGSTFVVRLPRRLRTAAPTLTNAAE